MKQVFISPKGEVEVIEVPFPIKMPGSVLVQNAYSLISTGTEGASVSRHGGWFGLAEKILQSKDRVHQVWEMVRRQGLSTTWNVVRNKLGEYAAPGYSSAGRIIEVSDNSLPYRPGDLVSCMGTGFAMHGEFVVVPVNLVAKIEKNVDLKQAAFGALGCIAIQGIRRLELTPGEVVGVIGLGLIGQLTVQLLSVMGFKPVGMDLLSERAFKANQVTGAMCWGMHEVDSVNRIREITEGKGLDGVIVSAATSSDMPVNLAFDLCRQHGRVSVIGDVGLKLDRARMYRKELELRMSCSYGPGRYDDEYEIGGHDYPLQAPRWTEQRNLKFFLDILMGPRLNIEPLISHICPVDKAGEGYALIKKSDPNLYGVVIDYQADFNSQPAVTSESFTFRHVKGFSGNDSRAVKLGLIGCGSFMKGIHLPNLKRLNDRFILAGVADRIGSAAEFMAQRENIPLATGNYRVLLGHEDIDAVVIATRHASHAQIVLDALEAGKHVFVEKPMCLTVEEGEAIVQKAEETGLIVRVGFNRRFSPYLREMKRSIGSDGARIFSCRVNIGSLSDDWSNTREEGGRLLGEGVHFFDLCNWFMDSAPIDMHAYTAGDQIPTNPNVIVQLKYPEGGLANVIYTAFGNKQASKEWFEAFGNGKNSCVDDYRVFKASGNEQGTKKIKKGDKGHFGELVEFADAIQSGAHGEGADARAGKLATEIAVKVYEQTPDGN